MKFGFFSMWERRDWAVGIGCGLVSFLVYFWTTAPNVTLLDSGEFLTASGHFGVPHPTGYPLWTILCGLFQRLPIGNLAWKGNLFSGFCGGLAVGLVAALLHQSTGWLFRAFSEEKKISPEFFDKIRLLISVLASLTFAFSVPMWTQAVITEVYTLHALLVVLYLTSIYRWIRDPRHFGGLIASVFFWALGMSNHHLVLVLLPLTVLLVLLLRIDLFLDFFFFLLAAGACVFLAYAALSADAATKSTAARFAYSVGAAVLILAWFKRGRVAWHLLPRLVLAMGLGFLPYLYMPLASSTNPPMNWGYTRAADGFYFSINRSQYSGSLNDLLNNSVGKLLGSKPPGEKEKPPEPSGLQELGLFGASNMFAGFFWIQLLKSFTPLFVVAFFLTLLSVLYLTPPARAWILLIYVSFIFAGFFEPFVSRAKIDLAGWLLQMPYHTYSFALFALISGTGLVFCLLWIRGRFSFSPNWLLLLVAVPGYTLYVNTDFCSQRGHWFGWDFGRDMLKDLPRGSIVYGGTDPGRFIPTYMIFGESFEKPQHKRDPDFDRRDLYIITQNAVIDLFYMRYVRDQYGPNRPPVETSLERWLGRDKAYPPENLVLPSEEEIRAIVDKTIKEEHVGEVSSALLDGPVAEWIFQKNKDKHAFFVEESFPMPWTYPYAIPHGLIYQINPEPLAELPPEAIKKDREYWTAYKDRLLANPLYLKDIDAQRSFSKLRNTTGNIYRFRYQEAEKAGKTALAKTMKDEAYLAYRQALELWTINPEPLATLMQMLTEDHKTGEALKLIDEALPQDPFNNDLFRLNQIAYTRDRLAGEILEAESARKNDPGDKSVILALLDLYLKVDDEKAIDRLIKSAMKTHPKDRQVLQTSISAYLQSNQPAGALEIARNWEKLEPLNDKVAYLMSRLIYAINGNGPELQKAVARALELGGEEMKENYRKDPLFGPLDKDGALEALLQPQQKSPKAPVSVKPEPVR